MDWPRAKTVLILAFLLLNTFLAYRLWWGQLPADEASGRVLTPDELRLIVDELEAAGVSVEAPLPARTPALARLSTSSVSDPESIAQRFFHTHKPPAPVFATDRTIWESPVQILTLFPDGTILLERQPFSPGEAPELDGRGVWDQLRARRVAQAFLEDNGWSPPTFIVDSVGYNPEVAAYEVSFVQTFEGWTVFDAITTITVGHWGVLAVEQVVLELGPFVGDRRPLLPAVAALRAMARELTAEELPLTVSHLSLGYRRTNSGAQAAPTWQITAADGRRIYVDAETGAIME